MVGWFVRKCILVINDMLYQLHDAYKTLKIFLYRVLQKKAQHFCLAANL